MYPLWPNEWCVYTCCCHIGRRYEWAANKLKCAHSQSSKLIGLTGNQNLANSWPITQSLVGILQSVSRPQMTTHFIVCSTTTTITPPHLQPMTLVAPNISPAAFMGFVSEILYTCNQFIYKLNWHIKRNRKLKNVYGPTRPTTTTGSHADGQIDRQTWDDLSLG